MAASLKTYRALRGTSLLKGLKERLEMEIERILDQLGPLPAPVEEHKTESKPESATTGGNAGKDFLDPLQNPLQTLPHKENDPGR